MADTLETLFNANLTGSDFNSSGEATLFTNSSSQRRVIKYVTSIEGSSSMPVNGTLKVGDHTLGSLSTDLEGTAIVGTGEALKVTSSNLPVVDEDIGVTWLGTGGYNQWNIPIRNGNEQSTLKALNSNVTTYNSWSNRTATSSYTNFYARIGGTSSDAGKAAVIQNDINSIQRMYVANSSGSEVLSHTTAYQQKAFDGKRYAYTFTTTHLQRADLWAASPSFTNLIQHKGGATLSVSTYPLCFTVAQDYVVYCTTYSGAANGPYVYDVANNTIFQPNSSSDGNSMLSYHDYRPYGIKLSDGTYVLMRHRSNSVFDVIKPWLPMSTTGYFESTNNYVQKSLTFNTDNQQRTMASDSIDKIYYLNNTDDLTSYNFLDDTNERVNGTTDMVFINDSNKPRLGVTRYTPLSSEVSARTYEGTPSIKIRVTGIKSE